MSIIASILQNVKRNAAYSKFTQIRIMSIFRKEHVKRLTCSGYFGIITAVNT